MRVIALEEHFTAPHLAGRIDPEVVRRRGFRPRRVASGAVNPLRYRRLVDLVQSWFSEHPLYDAKGQPIVVPDWSFPGRGRVKIPQNT